MVISAIYRHGEYYVAILTLKRGLGFSYFFLGPQLPSGTAGLNYVCFSLRVLAPDGAVRAAPHRIKRSEISNYPFPQAPTSSWLPPKRTAVGCQLARSLLHTKRYYKDLADMACALFPFSTHTSCVSGAFKKIIQLSTVMIIIL